VILRVPEYYDEFSCIASQCKDSCCAGWEIDIDDESYAYYSSRDGEFGKRLKESMYVAEDGGYRFRLKGPKRCAMLNDQNLCDLYTALGEEALCEVCTEYPRFSLFYRDVEQKALSLSCEEVGRILFSRSRPVNFVDHRMPDCYSDGEAVEESSEEEEDTWYIGFLEWAQEKAIAILQNRELSIEVRMYRFLEWCERIQDVTNHYLAREDATVLEEWRQKYDSDPAYPVDKKYERVFSYEDFVERFEVFSRMEELDDEWINTKKEFAQLFSEASYETLVREYLNSKDFSEIWYEQLLVYFVFRYLMNAAYDYDILTYAKLVVVATLVVRDMDVVRFQRNGGHFRLFDRIDVARIFSKEVEHSEGNADDLKEMCMMEEIASLDALRRQV
jgi:lysine-N-methylase